MNEEQKAEFFKELTELLNTWGVTIDSTGSADDDSNMQTWMEFSTTERAPNGRIGYKVFEQLSSIGPNGVYTR